MKFDFVIGNPPYQDNTIGENDTFAPPVYNRFMDAAYEVADKVELIHPARFLFDAGSTPKNWNQKMLNDPHFKVMEYEEDCRRVFANTDIKGGIAISYHDRSKEFGAIEIFTPNEILNSILQKTRKHKTFSSFSNIVVTRTAYRLTDKMHEDYPDAINQLSNGHAYDMSSNIFDRLPQIFFDSMPSDGLKYIKILGRENNERVYKYVRADYVRETVNLYKYKVLIPGASGVGQFGEAIASPLIAEPGVGTTETFISIGKFDDVEGAENVRKYVCTKYARAMLAILKKTQAITPEKWRYVPLQDFTKRSDIDWKKSVKEIDKQLYAKYNLTEEEIAFIEANVKEME